MGSIAELRLGTLRLSYSKNDVDPTIMMLFCESDKCLTQVTRAQLASVLGWDPDEDEADEERTVTLVQYVCSARAARDRLELMGFTREVVETGFYQGLKTDIQLWSDIRQKIQSGCVAEQLEENIQTLTEMTVGTWLSGLEEIKRRGLKPFRTLREASAYPPLLKYMLSEANDGYGFPGCRTGYGYRHFLRLVLDACSDTDQLTYDLTDLVLGGWLEETDEATAYAEEWIYGDLANSRRIIVLTEGPTDKWILERSLGVLYPHLSDYFRFLDFQGVNFPGGAGALANAVKAFAGVGIVNRVLALFDNDTAAFTAMRALSEITLPENMVVLRYPDIPLAKDYPTFGPSGCISMDVNGLAASIELYLGEDVLRDAGGNLTPIQWKGYEATSGRYYGEITRKAQLHDRVSQKLSACESDPSQIGGYDWTNIRAILDAMRTAYHSRDARRILGDTEGY